MLDLIRITATLAIVAVHLVDGGYRAAVTGVLALYWLSGYLAKPSKDPWRWWCSRYVRIWPAYAVVFAVSSIAFSLGAHTNIHLTGNPALPYLIAQSVLIVKLGIVRVVGIGWMLSAQLFAFAVIAICGDRKNSVLMALGTAIVLIVGQGWKYQSLPVAVAFTLAGYLMQSGWGKDWRIPGVALCYPVLLLHTPVAAVIGLAKGWPLFWAALFPTLCLSWLLVLWVEQPIANFRKTLRSNPHV